MTRTLTGFAIGLGLVGVMAATGLVWPAASGYLATMDGSAEHRIAQTPKFDRAALDTALKAQGLARGDEAHVRIFKREKQLELWLRHAGSERFVPFRSYAICTYSGGLGPKLAEGDHQAPEGFYRVSVAQLNPKSRHHLAINLGFPNAFDREQGRTGSLLMVHGGCTSVGCYAMTDAQIDDIYAVVEAALEQGQPELDVSIFPFRLSEDALAAESGSDWAGFWRNLKQGSDLFERDGMPPEVATCEGQYRFGDDALTPGCTPIAGWA